MLNDAKTALSSSVGDQVENLRDHIARKASGSHFVLTPLFQASSIRLSRRRARRLGPAFQFTLPQPRRDHA